VANVTTDNGDLVVANNASPVAPAASTAKLISMNVGGRSMLGEMAATNVATPLQPHLGRNKFARWYISGTTVFSADGMAVPNATGTNTARVPASTSLCTSIRRVGYVSTAGAGATCGLNPTSTAIQHWRGNAAGLGGFHAIFRFNISDAVLVATANMFVGLKATIPTDVAPSTLTNMIGIGCDNGDTTLQVYAAGAAAQARVNLGANFPVNTISTDVYELDVFAAPNDSQITYTVTRLNTGHTSGPTVVSAAANLFSNTTFVGPYFFRSNGGTAAAVAIDVISCTIESDY
jgi:hypothetical protein